MPQCLWEKDESAQGWRQRSRGEDYREGLPIISVKLTDAQFEGQTKAKLGNSEMRTLVSAIVSEKLEEFWRKIRRGQAILDKALTASWPRRPPGKPGSPSAAKNGL